MDIREFYEEVRKWKVKLQLQLKRGDHAGQPPLIDWKNPDTDEMEKKAAEVYIVSVRNQAYNTTAGTVSCAPIQLAAYCLAKQTHVIATAEQIDGMKKEGELRLQRMLQEEWDKAAKKEIVRERPAAPVSGAHLAPVGKSK